MGMRLGLMGASIAIAMISAAPNAVADSLLNIHGVTSGWIKITNFNFNRDDKRSATVAKTFNKDSVALNRAWEGHKLLRRVWVETTEPNGGVETAYLLSDVVISQIAVDNPSSAHMHEAYTLQFKTVETRTGR